MKHNYCVACGVIEDLHHHHLIPKSRGGSNDDSNIITLCVNCHEKIHGVNNSLITLSSITRKKKKQEGKRISGLLPYGKMLDIDGETLIDNPIEQKIIKMACEISVSLNCGSRIVSSELAKKGFYSRNGNPFDSVQILRILKACDIEPKWQWSDSAKENAAKIAKGEAIRIKSDKQIITENRINEAEKVRRKTLREHQKQKKIAIKNYIDSLNNQQQSQQVTL